MKNLPASARSIRVSVLFLGLTALAACVDSRVEEGAAPLAAVGPWSGLCVDEDRDGHGFQCEAGPDCNDDDPTVHAACPSCNRPDTGCACLEGSAPVSCHPTPEFGPGSSLVCKQGTRYCRDGLWSGCEGITQFEIPPAAGTAERGGEKGGLQVEGHRFALLDPDAGDVICSPCRPDCFRVEDPIDSDGSSLDDYTVVDNGSGGITLPSQIEESDGGVVEPPECMPGTSPDRDCDGIPDEFDAFPDEPPFATDNATIFMDLEAGESESAGFEIRFFLSTADVYFLVDMTASMAGERAQLLSDLTNDNFLPDPDVDCADRDFDGEVDDDNVNKERGIAGNIACLIRNARLGAGWFRELPFQCGTAGNPASSTSTICYGNKPFSVYEHVADISTDVESVRAAIQSFQTAGNRNWPEAHMEALYTVATGEQLYTGWDRRGVPDRVSMSGCEPGTYGCCPEGSWGYPCFNEEAVPIIILISDASMTGGPMTGDGTLGEGYWLTPLAWDATALDDASFGSTEAYAPIIGSANEDFNSMYRAGRVDDALLTFTGDTSIMTADMSTRDLGCGDILDDTDGTDAVVHFEVQEGKNLVVSALGTRFDPTLMIFRDDGTLQDNEPTFIDLNPDNLNDINAADLGLVTPTVVTEVTGSTSAMDGHFSREALGCFDEDWYELWDGSWRLDNGSDLAPDAVFNFRVTEDGPYTIDLGQSAGFDGVMALFASQPRETEACSFASGCASTSGASGSTLDSALNVGDVSGRSLRVTDGDTLSAGDDYGDAAFSSLGCLMSPNTPEQVVEFSLSSPTRVRIELAGDDARLQTYFDSVIGLAKLSEPDPVVVAASGNDDESSAQTVNPALLANPGDALRFTGSTASLAADYAQDDVGGPPSDTAPCGQRAGGATDSRDAVFAFTPGADVTLDLDTEGSGFTTYLSVHEGDVASGGGGGPVVQNVASNNNNDSTPQALGAINGQIIHVTGGDTGAPGMTGRLKGKHAGCSATRDGKAVKALFTFVVEGSDPREIELDTSGSSLDTVLSIYGGVPHRNNRIACNNNESGSTTDSRILQTLYPGTYHVSVRGYWSSSTGTYNLNITDNAAGSGPASSLRACDSGSFPGNNQFSSLSYEFESGETYYLVLKGGEAVQASYDYVLNLRRSSGGTLDLLACDKEGLDDDRPMLEQDLEAGSYAVIVGGAGTESWDDDGLYRLSIRDVAHAPTPLGCVSEVGEGSSMSVDLVAQSGGASVDYHLVLRGHEDSDGGGAYRLVVGGASDASPIACRDNDSGYMPHYEGYFEPGEYAAVLKGYDEDEAGWYQLTIGDPDLSQANMSYAPHTYLGPMEDGNGGVLEALTSRNVRVMSVLSDNDGDLDTHAKEQMVTLANATGAQDVGGNPLVFEINGDGSGMGSAILKAVQLLSENLEMDVGVRLVEDPDDPTPDFLFEVEALDQPGDLCDAPIDTDGDSQNLPDTHQNCGPGATPQFSVTFTNRPAPNNVPLNTGDPNGGYQMRLELIGDGQYVVDSIPVYIIPEDVVPDGGMEVFDAEGVYTQSFSATGCQGTELPDWDVLSWNATMPEGTSLRWEACLESTAELLAQCTDEDYVLIANVAGGGTCGASSDCTRGFCQAGKCQIVTGPACSDASECGNGGSCVEGACYWASLPVDTAPALANGLYSRIHMSLRVVMGASEGGTSAPTLHDWQIEYLCGSSI